MRSPFFFSLVLFSLWGGYAAAAEPVRAAEVLYVSGTVKLNGVDAKKGDAVPVGSTIETQINGHVYMRAIDGGFLVVRGDSKAAIQAYDVQDKNAVRIKIELTNGTARSITGSAAKANKEGFRFNTPVAAIGVRGTDFTVQTSATETLVAVASGGVAVSPLNESCLSSGFGPCHGDFVADLYASDKGFLRVVKGANAPVLVDQPAAAPNVPLPADKVSEGVRTPELLTVFEEVLAFSSTNRNQTDAVKPDMPPPVFESNISWGRWQAVANSQPDAVLFENVANGSGHAGLRLLGPHFIAEQLDRVYSRPVENEVTFAAAGFDAYLGLANGALLPAQVSGANLSVNFNSRQFTSEFDVGNSLGSMTVLSTGTVGSLGNLEGGIVGSNAKVVGYLEGSGATHATTIFNTFGGGQYDATGVLRWAR